MAVAEKFTFGQDFGKPGAAPMAPSSMERDRADREARVRAEAFAQGVAEGRRQAQVDVDQRAARAFESVAASAASLAADLDRLTGEAVGLALTFSDAVAEAAAKRFPTAALESAARDIFTQLRKAPHCVVRVHESLIDRANDDLTRAARERGFDGKLVVMGDPDMAVADFSIEWADGGVMRDGAALRRRLVEIIERHAPHAASGWSES